jgi:signal transduction histidine kinase
VRPLVDALNDLFGRLDRSFANERRFTGDAAHELRTPLAALKTQAQVALTSPDPERRRRALDNVVAGVDRATRLVEQLLALARLDAMLPPSGGIVDMRELAQNGVRDLAPQADARGIRLWLEARGPEAPHVRGEGELLGLLVRNLVDNAIRYTPPGGRVRVTLWQSGDRVTLAVADSGAGVAPEARERIFDRFFRAGGEPSTGSGLGLSIAQAVVALHGGSIRAEPSADLGGLSVVATLPALPKDSLRNAA